MYITVMSLMMSRKAEITVKGWAIIQNVLNASSNLEIFWSSNIYHFYSLLYDTCQGSRARHMSKYSQWIFAAINYWEGKIFVYFTDKGAWSSRATCDADCDTYDSDTWLFYEEYKKATPINIKHFRNNFSNVFVANICDALVSILVPKRALGAAVPRSHPCTSSHLAHQY